MSSGQRSKKGRGKRSKSRIGLLKKYERTQVMQFNSAFVLIDVSECCNYIGQCK